MTHALSNRQDTIDIYMNDAGELIRVPSLPSDGYGEDLLHAQREWAARQPSGPRLQFAWMAQGNRGLSPDFFVAEMRFHWIYNLDNCSTMKLEALWRIICETYNAQLEAKPGDAWPVLAPPTGSGKTQSACLYSALLALYTDDGVLFTTRLIDQCDAVVADINEMAEFHFKRFSTMIEWKGPVAIAAHSKQGKAKRDPTEQDRSPVLVITHQNMVNIYKEALTDGTDGRFEVITQWGEGAVANPQECNHPPKTRIRIVDETPAGLIEHFKVDMAALRAITGHFETEGVPEEFEEEYAAFKYVRNAWRAQEAAKADNKDPSKVFALSDFLPKTDVPKRYSLKGLIGLLRETAATKSASFKRDTMADLRSGTLAGLYSVQHVLNNWSVYMKNGGECGPVVTSAQFIAPRDGLPSVILDATADVSPYWKAFGTKIERVDIPPGVRNYRNVTAHLCHTTGGIGTGVTNGKLGKTRLAAILKFFEKDFKKTGDKLRVLLCMPKDLKLECLPTLKDGITAKSIPSYMEDLKVGHWGALDGRNEFKDCNAVVVMSWFYPPKTFAIDLLFSTASQTQRTDEFLKSTKELQKDIEFGHVLTSVIQGVNRVRCRSVINKDGDCKPTQIFLLMPEENKSEAQDMKAALGREMPGMVFADWDVLPKPKGGRVSHAQRFVEHLRVLPAGEYRFAALMDKLTVAVSGRKKLREALNGADSSLSQSLKALGCRYEVRRNGKFDQPTIIKQ